MINGIFLLNIRANGCRQKISERTGSAATANLKQVAMTFPQGRNAATCLQLGLPCRGQIGDRFSEFRFLATQKRGPHPHELRLLVVEAVELSGGRGVLQLLAIVAQRARYCNRRDWAHICEDDRCKIAWDDGLARSLRRAALAVGQQQAGRAEAYNVVALMGPEFPKHKALRADVPAASQSKEHVQ